MYFSIDGSPTYTPTGKPTPPPTKPPLTGGAITGIAIGAFSFSFLLGVGIWYYCFYVPPSKPLANSRYMSDGASPYVADPFTEGYVKHEIKSIYFHFILLLPYHPFLLLFFFFYPYRTTSVLVDTIIHYHLILSYGILSGPSVQNQ